MSTNRSKRSAVEQQSRKTRKRYKHTEKNLHTSGNSEVTQTRRAQKIKRKLERRMNKKPRRRIFPIWLRIIVVLILCIAALIGGLLVGYGIIGDGVPGDALKTETWQHIIDIVMQKK